MKSILVTALLLAIALQVCNGEIFSALATLKKALYIEKNLANHLRSYVSLIADADRAQKVSQSVNLFFSIYFNES